MKPNEPPQDLSASTLREWSEEQLRVKVAELCGWTKRDVDYGPRTENLWISPDGLTNGPSNTARWLPDYPNDLNAMREAMATLNKDQRKAFVHFLDAMFDDPDCIDWPLIDASAKDRVIAFILTCHKEKI